jgi:hypothetical protein
VRSTDTSIDLKTSARDAAHLRREIARLFDARPAERIVLAPGMLSALRHLFSALGIDRLALTSDEYYAPRHFPAMTVDAVGASALVARVKATRPGAVIVSVVSWQGRALPVAELFAAIRRRLGARAPLLVADYTHAGAIGFPPLSSLNADVVAGDPEKWLLPPDHASRLTFLWTRSPKGFRAAERLFSPFFLAVEGRSDARSARWIDPLEVREVARWLSDVRLTRRALHDLHEANLRMKQMVARRLGVDPTGAASVLWTDQRIPRSLETQLNRHHLLWRDGTGHSRILCRADHMHRNF